MRKKTKQIPIGFTKRHREMIEQIMEAKGYPSLSSTVQQAVVEMHGSVFKDYVMAKKARTEGTEGRSKEEIKKSIQTDKFENTCQVLGGVLMNRNGVAYCDYFTYERKNRYKQEVPLTDLSDTNISKQYFPSKEAVEKLQKEKKVNY